jgi:protein KRI1
MATDKELNEYISIKRLAPYKSKNKGNWDNERNEKLKALKSSIASRTWDGVPVGQLVGSRHGERKQNGMDGKKKRMGRKERNKLKAAASEGREQERANSDSERPKKKIKKEKNEV